MTNINQTDLTSFECDLCHSQDIIETREGYVCRDCGVVLDYKKLEYHTPYDLNKIHTHHSKLQGIGTTIGTLKERLSNGNSVKLKRLYKLQNRIKDRKAIILNEANKEIDRIFSILLFPEQLKTSVLNTFMKFYNILTKSTKYRTPEKLIPISIYYVCKTDFFPINQDSLLRVSKISLTDFNDFKKHFYENSSYPQRNRVNYILQKAFEVAEDLNLGLNFYYHVKKIIQTHFKEIWNTTDDVICGLICVISFICKCYPKQDITIHAICKKVGITMSSIQFQLRKFFNKRNIPFTTTVDSIPIIKDFFK